MASWSPFALRDPLMALVWINIILWLVLGYVYYNDPAGVGRAIAQITRLAADTFASLTQPICDKADRCAMVNVLPIILP